MIELPFITTQSATNDDVKDATKHAIYELNNELTIPMKIEDITYTADKNNEGWTIVRVFVEDCADKKEWSTAVSILLIGAEWKRKMFRATISK